MRPIPRCLCRNTCVLCIPVIRPARLRIRQLRSHNDTLEKQISRLKTQLEAAKAAAKVEG